MKPSYRVVPPAAADLIVALKAAAEQTWKLNWAGVREEEEEEGGRCLLTFILWVVLMKLAIQALMSSFTPTTGIKQQTRSIIPGLPLNFTP